MNVNVLLCNFSVKNYIWQKKETIGTTTTTTKSTDLINLGFSLSKGNSILLFNLLPLPVNCNPDPRGPSSHKHVEWRAGRPWRLTWFLEALRAGCLFLAYFCFQISEPLHALLTQVWPPLLWNTFPASLAPSIFSKACVFKHTIPFLLLKKEEEKDELLRI